MQITPYNKNAKKHPKKQIEQIANSIKEFGMNQPIVVDKHGVIIVDLFLGTGACLIASEKWGRICYGMELDPKYTDVIVQRYVDHTGNDKIKLNGKEIIWPTKAS